MIYWLFLLLAILGQLFFPAVCFVLLVVAVGIYRAQDKGKMYFLAFLWGLITDLISGTLFGSSGIFFLTFCLIFQLFEKQLARNFSLLIMQVIVWMAVYYWLFSRSVILFKI